jgi:Na+/melibiose symporter-like transporter
MIMSVFSVLTIMNVRNKTVRPIQQPVVPNLAVQLNGPLTTSSDERTRLKRKRDRQLIRLCLVQVVSYIILNITTSVYPLYLYLTRSQSASNADQQAISSFISTMGLILLYTYSAVSIHSYLYGCN